MFFFLHLYDDYVIFCIFFLYFGCWLYFFCILAVVPVNISLNISKSIINNIYYDYYYMAAWNLSDSSELFEIAAQTVWF